MNNTCPCPQTLLCFSHVVLFTTQDRTLFQSLQTSLCATTRSGKVRIGHCNSTQYFLVSTACFKWFEVALFTLRVSIIRVHLFSGVTCVIFACLPMVHPLGLYCTSIVPRHVWNRGGGGVVSLGKSGKVIDRESDHLNWKLCIYSWEKHHPFHQPCTLCAILNM